MQFSINTIIRYFISTTTLIISPKYPGNISFKSLLPIVFVMILISLFINFWFQRYTFPTMQQNISSIVVFILCNSATHSNTQQLCNTKKG